MEVFQNYHFFSCDLLGISKHFHVNIKYIFLNATFFAILSFFTNVYNYVGKRSQENLLLFQVCILERTLFCIENNFVIWVQCHINSEKSHLQKKSEHLPNILMPDRWHDNLNQICYWQWKSFKIFTFCYVIFWASVYIWKYTFKIVFPCDFEA